MTILTPLIVAVNLGPSTTDHLFTLPTYAGPPWAAMPLADRSARVFSRIKAPNAGLAGITFAQYNWFTSPPTYYWAPKVVPLRSNRATRGARSTPSIFRGTTALAR